MLPERRAWTEDTLETVFFLLLLVLQVIDLLTPAWGIDGCMVAHFTRGGGWTLFTGITGIGTHLDVRRWVRHATIVDRLVLHRKGCGCFIDCKCKKQKYKIIIYYTLTFVVDELHHFSSPRKSCF